MNKQLPGFARRILIILFWIILWQFAASLIRNHIFLVGPVDTLRALCEQALLPAFWSAILFSFGRICLGFFLAFFLTRYVSVGSLVLAVLFPICVLIFYPGQWHLFIVSLVFCAMAFWRHRSNIVRLANGTENRFDKKKKKG